MNDFKSDSEILEYIDSLPYSDLVAFSTNYIITDFNHYMKLQVTWMEDEKYLLGTQIHRSPNELELIQAWDKHHNAERFRAFYVLKYTGSMRVNELE